MVQWNLFPTYGSALPTLHMDTQPRLCSATGIWFSYNDMEVTKLDTINDLAPQVYLAVYTLHTPQTRAPPLVNTSQYFQSAQKHARLACVTHSRAPPRGETHTLLITSPPCLGITLTTLSLQRTRTVSDTDTTDSPPPHYTCPTTPPSPSAI